MKNIVLIGMTGVGKTTIGKCLSNVLDKEFVDTDDLIEKKMEMKIPNIFTQYGEEYFRSLESDVIDMIYKDHKLIISTGGGIVLNKDNINKLKENGMIVLLESSIETIINNIENSFGNRPLLNNEENMISNITALYEKRKILYFDSANIIINVDNKSIEDIVYEIIDKCVKI